jgi:hypothetical protein
VPEVKNRVTGRSMGEHTEDMAKTWNIGRQEQDELALQGRQRAVAAQDRGFFEDLIVPVVYPVICDACCWRRDREHAQALNGRCDMPHKKVGRMQSILDHIAAVIQPALRKYLAAEKALTDALEFKDAGGAGTARQDVMLAARQATDVLHHLSDFVLKEPSPG